ncbi:hypothetical protein V8B55DRAFT_1450394 [Mucor lusitanicus]|uniref:RING-type domain-containing protein n=1 Tax=Mucor circinelloides f. lusitanicus TaxID=29924 RepID=A0A8H4BEM2_MUCCL|nr:hypothetical protein FB192DRAFT_1382109 [Mucor lusitanicus]
MASDQATEKLAKITKELTCSICTYILDDPNALHCGHAFCGLCIHEWLGNSKTCPMCRVQIVRQPVHVTALQELADLIRPTPSSRKRLIRENWVALFPIENNITFIVDEDEDGIVHRCSQCSWELSEDNYCVRCNIQYDGAMPIRDIPDRDGSDIDSDMNEPESNLDGFVVSDDEVEFDDDVPNSFATQNSRRYTIDDSDVESLSDSASAAGAIEISDDEDMPSLRTRLNRKRRLPIDSDEESLQYLSDAGPAETNEDSSESEDEVEYRSTPRQVYSRPDVSDEEESDYYQDDFPEDPFTRPSHVSRFIDDVASEDDEEEDTSPQRPQKVDAITETINRARSQMEQNNTTNSNANNTAAAADSSSSSSSSDDDSDAPDYEFMISQPTPEPSSSTSAAKPMPTKDTSVPPKPQTEEGEASTAAAAAAAIAAKNKLREKRKRAKRNKKNRAKHEKKKHKPNE